MVEIADSHQNLSPAVVTHVLLLFIIFMSVVYLRREIMGILLFVLWYFSVCISISLLLAVFQLTNHLSIYLFLAPILPQSLI